MLEGLQQARKDAGLSRTEVCERMGIHYNTVKNWELGATEPKASEIAELARLYGCSVEKLYGATLAPGEADGLEGEVA